MATMRLKVEKAKTCGWQIGAYRREGRRWKLVGILDGFKTEMEASQALTKILRSKP